MAEAGACVSPVTILSVGEHPLSKNVWYVTVKNQGTADAPACKLSFEATVILPDNSSKKVTRLVDLQPLKAGEKVKWGFDINKDLPPWEVTPPRKGHWNQMKCRQRYGSAEQDPKHSKLPEMFS